MSIRTRPLIMLECLESRTLMAVDAGSLLVPIPVLASNSFLESQFGGIAQIQLGADEGPAEALSLQSSSSLDLSGSLPSAGLSQQFAAQLTPVPAVPSDAFNAAITID